MDCGVAPWGGNSGLPCEPLYGSPLHLRGLHDGLSLLLGVTDIPAWLFLRLLFALGRMHVAFLLHASRRALLHVFLYLLDRGLLKHVSHDVEVAQIFSQLRFPNINELLLADAIPTHVLLDSSRMKVLVLLDDRDNV